MRFCIAAWNAFSGPSFGSGPDAVGFHANAVAFAAGSWREDFQLPNSYIYALGTIYRWTASSLFLGCSLSCLAWGVSAIVLLKMMKLLMLTEDHQVVAMLLYALLPSSLLMTSVTLREAYQLLAVNFVVYMALRIYVDRLLTMGRFLSVVIGVAFMGVLQPALLLAGLCIAAVAALFLIFDERDPRSLIKMGLVICVFGFVAYLGSSILLSKIFNSDLNLSASVQLRQESLPQSARAAYSIGMRVTSNFDLMLFIPLAFLHYLFEPMPWKISTVPDAALFAENLIRALLLGFVVAGFAMKAFAEKPRVALVFAAYLIIEIVWAIGTLNWGTAARHHIPAFGLLVLAACAFSKKQFVRPPVKHVNANNE